MDGFAAENGSGDDGAGWPPDRRQVVCMLKSNRQQNHHKFDSQEQLSNIRAKYPARNEANNTIKISI